MPLTGPERVRIESKQASATVRGRLKVIRRLGRENRRVNPQGLELNWNKA
jgi:hypothetical protein